MTQTTIHLVSGIQGFTLLVFYSDVHCWQWRLISAGGTVFSERKLYYTPEAVVLQKLVEDRKLRGCGN